MTLRRLPAILAGYALSCLVTSFLWPIAFRLVVLMQGRPGMGPNGFSPILGSAFYFGVAMAPYFAVVCSPALIAIGLFEWTAERRWWPFATFGASMAAVMSLVVSTLVGQPPALATLSIVSVYTVIGILAATAYWLVAIRFFTAPAS